MNGVCSCSLSDRAPGIPAAPPSPNPSDYSSSSASLGAAGGRRWQKTSFLRSALGPAPSSSASSSAAAVAADAASAASDSLGHYYSQGGLGGPPQRIVDPETEAHFDGLLSAETSMVVLDTLETIVQVVSQTDHGSTGLLASVLRVLLHALGTNQSAYFLGHLFAVQRSFVFKFPSLLFDEASEHCADLCLRLLRHCR